MGASQSISDSSALIYEKPQLAALKTALEASSEPLVVDNIPLTPKQIHEIIVTVIGLEKIADPLYSVIDGFSRTNPYMGHLMSLDLSQDPTGIDHRVKKVLTQLVNRSDLKDFDTICSSLNNILPLLAPIFGDWVGLFLTQDNIDQVLQELIEMGAHDSFRLIETFYNTLPSEVQNMFKNKETIEHFLKSVLIQSRKRINYMNTADQNGLTNQAVEMAYGYLGQILTSKILEEQFRPAIRPSARILSRIIPVTFVVLSINEFCTRNETASSAGPINIGNLERA